jgi:hypothetical protein
MTASFWECVLGEHPAHTSKNRITFVAVVFGENSGLWTRSFA